MRTVSVKLMADASNFKRGIGAATTDVKGLARELDKTNKRGGLDHVTDAAAGLGIGLLGAAAMTVKFSMAFEKQMSGVKAATHGSAAEIDALRKASLQAGKDTSFSATEAAKGVEELAKAGISTADILGGGLKGALDLAAAGELDVGQAAETAASALTQFKLSGKDVPHVADLLSAAAGKAQGSVADMSAALNQAGLIAAGTGLSIEETTGTLAAFASAGLLGSDAGTSFKTMLQAIQAPSGKTKELMDDLGVSAYDVGGNFVGIANFAQNLKDKLSVLTPEVRANAMAQIFGSDATRAANILYEQGSKGITEWIAKTDDAGYAAETAAIKTDNLAGDLERLKGSLETAAIESGGGLNQGLRVLTKSADALVGTLEKLPSGTTAAITVVAALGGALTLGLVAWMKSRAAIAAVVAELNAVGPAGARAATGLQAASKWAGRAGIAFVGLQVVSTIFDQFGNGAVKVDKLTAALQDYATTGQLTKGFTDVFGDDLEYLGRNAWLAEQGTHGLAKSLNDISNTTGLSGIIDTLSEWTTGTSINDSTMRMESLDESLTAFIGTQKDAKKAGELWNQVLLKSGLEYEQLQALLPNASAALTELQKTSHSGASAQGALAASASKTAEELEKEKEKAKELKAAFDELFGAQMSMDRANIKYAEGAKALTKELAHGRREIRLDTEEGRNNRSAVLDQIDTINDLREARIAHGDTLDVANGKYLKDIEGLRKTLRQAGFTKKQIDDLTGAYRKIPGEVSTDLSVVGAKSVGRALATLGDMQKALKNGTAPKGGWSASSGTLVKAINDPKLRAAGGPIDGPGTETSDSIHAMLSKNEYVVKASSAKKLGLSKLNYLNTYGELPAFAAGGSVRWPYPVTAAMTRIPSKAEALAAVTPAFSRDWPSSPSAQRGDSGIWRDVLRLIRSGPKSGSFGNAYRHGDPKWHGSGRAVDWMGYNQDRLASYLAAQRPLELIHRTRTRDYAYTRGVNKGSFNAPLMNAHRNHIHIAMAGGGVINEHVVGVGKSGATYEFGENGRPETVTPGVNPWMWTPGSGGAGGGKTTYVTVGAPVINVIGASQSPAQIAAEVDRRLGARIDHYARGV